MVSYKVCSGKAGLASSCLNINRSLIIPKKDSLVHHLKKLDLLRGIAILMVFLFHCHLIFFGQSGPSAISTGNNETKNSLSQWIISCSPTAFGWVGVPLFLLISGFLIHLGFLKEGVKFRFRTFFSKRFWRIFIPYWFSLGAFIIAENFLNNNTASPKVTDIILHLLTLHNLNDHYFYSINPAYWSLAVEVQLYLLYPFFLLLRKWLGIRNCFVLLILLSVTLTIIGIGYNNFGTLYSYSKNTLGLWFIWAAGAWYAEAVYLPGKRLFPKYAMSFLLLSLFSLLISSFFTIVNNFAFHLATLVCVIFFDSLLNDNLFSENKLASKFLIFTGVSSYSLYLIHQPYLKLLLNLCGAQSGNRFRLLSVIPAFLITLVSAYLLYKTLELPAVRFGKRLRDKGFFRH